MKHRSLIILIILCFVSISSADTFTLSNGDTLIGQLLKVSNNHLLVEVMKLGKGLATISLNRKKVISVVDESETTLYIHGYQLEDDLEDYYKKPYLDFLPESSVKDTIVLKNGLMMIGDIIRLYKTHITYKQKNDSSKQQINLALKEIDTINNQKVESVPSITAYNPPPIKRIFDDPHPSIEFGLTLIQHDLNQYHEIYYQVAENLEDFNIGNLRDINNPLIAINLGFDYKFSSKISLSFLGNFLLNYGDKKDYHEEVESFRLFLAEIRYTFPLKSFSPWIGIGFALQSITLINNFSGADIKFKSQSNTISYAGGIILRINSQFEGNFSLRYLPFGDKNITLISQTSPPSEFKINLTNILFSASLDINL